VRFSYADHFHSSCLLGPSGCDAAAFNIKSSNPVSKQNGEAAANARDFATIFGVKLTNET
jgi:hypothetical protein